MSKNFDPLRERNGGGKRTWSAYPVPLWWFHDGSIQKSAGSHPLSESLGIFQSRFQETLFPGLIDIPKNPGSGSNFGTELRILKIFFSRRKTGIQQIDKFSNQILFKQLLKILHVTRWNKLKPKKGRNGNTYSIQNVLVSDTNKGLDNL